MSALASRFARPVSFRSSEPLSDAQIMRVAPSIFATDPHHSRSARYAFVPTLDVLSALRREGFEPFMVGQTRTRIADRHEFTKHMIRLRHASQIDAQEANEIILLNSHDGTSSYQMLAGMFRFVCMNGLVCGDIQNDIRVQHKGNLVDDVIEGAYSVVENFRSIEDKRDTMKAITLSQGEQDAFAGAALLTKYEPNEQGNFPILPSQVLRPRRYDDSGNDLWTVFNRTQENLIKGGLRGRTATNRRTTTREVAGIDQNVKVNRALWQLAESMAALKAA
jgi:hypothetical protein